MVAKKEINNYCSNSIAAQKDREMAQKKQVDVEVQVTWEDQNNINTFGRLNGRMHELEDEISKKKVLTPRNVMEQILLILLLFFMK